MLKEQMKQNQMSCQPQWKSEISSYEPVDAETLLATPLPPVRWLVPDLLPTGLSLLAGASKTGKSWLCLWLCLQLAQGGEIWGRQVQPQTVLYLSLENTPKRIQNRLSQLTEAPVPSRLYFQTRCEAIGEGLEFELELFLAKHPETGLIVIDTLQKVRIDTQNSGVYAGDYQDMSALKSIADSYSMGILVVHHLRKQGANDPFLQISGSNGLMGAADAILLLQRQRMNSTAKLLVTGRDMDSRTLRLQWDGCLWNCMEETGSQEREKQEIPDYLWEAAEFIQKVKIWQGTAADFLNAAGITGVQPNQFTRKLVEYYYDVFLPKKSAMKAAAPPKRGCFSSFMTMMTVMTAIQAYPPRKRGIPKKHRHHRHRKKIALTERNSYRKHSAWISRAQTGGSSTSGFGIGSRSRDEVRRRFPIRLYPILRKILV